MTRQLRAVYPAASFLPELIVGATDARFFREKGVVSYGTGLFSRNVTMSDFAARFHGHDERVDVESLGLCTDYWMGIVTDLLG
jgi:acetylornithine deacetylase/succinyl-diaminopimelate desuccinylase-like protein